MKKMMSVMRAGVGLVLLSGCASANHNSEVMVDTSAQTKKSVPEGGAAPSDVQKMSDPFLSGN